MNCDWDSYLRLVPSWMRNDVDRLGRNTLEELRLRVGHPPGLVMQNKLITLGRNVSNEDILHCINAASRYSPWVATTIRHGYITAAGGHRIGVCGDAIVDKFNAIEGMQTVNMLCIRVAKSCAGVSKTVPIDKGSVLVIGCPGAGKTTVLRDLVCRYSFEGVKSIGVVDERGELFPIHQGKYCFETGPKTDIVSWTNKKQGVEMLLRCMNPGVIAVDEITSDEDCRTLLHAGWCGVKIFATAHASCMEDLVRRPVYQLLLEGRIFDVIVIVRQDRTLHIEMVRDACCV